jgi:hypothetical protein
MSDLINNSDDCDKFERFVAMAAGEFWRCSGEISITGVEQGHILLIEKLDVIDGAPHTLHMRYHPSVIKTQSRNTFKIRVTDFVDNFEFVEKGDADISRQNNIAGIQQKMAEVQAKLADISMNPAKLDDLIASQERKQKGEHAALPVKIENVDADVIEAINSQKVSALMSPGLTPKGVAQIKEGMQHQRDLTVKRSEYINARTREISTLAHEMTPYFEEQAATVLAMNSEMTSHVDKLMKGIGTLNLYVLENVAVEKIKEGVSAPSSVPLTIAQSILYMDEEAVVYADVGDEFDARNRVDFFEYLANNKELQAQIFPSERSVVGMAATRTEKNYQAKGYSSIESVNLTIENSTMFLVIKDGENLSVVLSPELWHQQTKCLFPSTNEVEAQFKGLDGRDITYDDIDYTSSVNKHESLALKYKRLLVLLCGLDHNEGLFGNFYDGAPSLDFISLEFQRKYFRFVHDASGEGLISTSRPNNVNEWIKELNSEVGVGSRLLILSHYGVTEDTVPSAYESSRLWHTVSKNKPSRQYSVTTNDEGYFVGVISEYKGKMVIPVELSGYNKSYEERVFNSKLYVDELLKLRGAYLCLDRVNPLDVDWYIADRRSRSLNVETIRLLKNASHYSAIVRDEEAEVRVRLHKALEDGGILDGDKAQIVVDKSMAKWRCANPRKDINIEMSNSKKFNALCDQMYTLAGLGRDVLPLVDTKERGAGRSIVRLTILSNGMYCAYSALKPEEQDNRLFPYSWVMRTRYTLSKKGVKSSPSTFVLLSKVENKETVIYEAKDVESHIFTKVPFKTPLQKSKLFDSLESPKAVVDEINLAIRDDSVFEELINRLAKRSRLCTKTVIPVGFMLDLFDDKYAVMQLALVVDDLTLLSRLCGSSEKRLSLLTSSVRQQVLNRQSKSSNRPLLLDFDLMVIEEPVSGVFTVVSVGSYCHPLTRSDLKQYSHDDAIAKRKEKRLNQGVWIHPDFEGSVDTFCGVTPPDDFEPHILRKPHFFNRGKDNILLFKASDVEDLRSVSFGQPDILYFDTLSDALKHRYLINAVPIEGELPDFNGVKPLKAWAITEF